MNIIYFEIKVWAIVVMMLCISRIAEGFAFLVCTKWSNPLIRKEERLPLNSSESARNTSQSLPSTSSVGEANGEESEEGLCGLENIGGHFMKVPVILFQILLCMKLEVVFYVHFFFVFFP